MSTLRYILPRVFLVLAILFALNWVYEKYFWWDDLETHADVLNNLRKVEQEADMLYLAESSNSDSPLDDPDKRSIHEFAASYYPELKFRVVEKGALHARIYAALIENLSKESSIQTVVVTMNLRSFSADWIHSDLESFLSKVELMMAPRPPLVNRFLLTVRHYQRSSEKERWAVIHEKWKNEKIKWPYDFEYDNIYDWDRGMAEKGWYDESGEWDQEQVQLGTQFIKNFGFQIDAKSNPRVKDFDRIVELCEERGYNLVFNLLAENSEGMHRLLGKELLYLLRQNRDFLKNRYEKNGVIVVDNLEAVPEKEFSDKLFPTEHYAHEGRKTIGRNLALRLRTFYSDKFVEQAQE